MTALILWLGATMMTATAPLPPPLDTPERLALALTMGLLFGWLLMRHRELRREHARLEHRVETLEATQPSNQTGGESR